MRRARAASALVCFDLNLRPARWTHVDDPHPVMWSGLALADIVKLSAEEFEYLTNDGEDAFFERLWSGHTRLLVITDGPAPMRWFAREANGELPTFSCDVVDSTAAGDAFVAGLLHGLASAGVDAARFDAWSMDIRQLHATLRLAAACGALTVTRRGSFSAMPDMDEVAAFMETRR
jgi:fructokinase